MAGIIHEEKSSPHRANKKKLRGGPRVVSREVVVYGTDREIGPGS